MPHHDIIVIGGSSGATVALKSILREFPVDLPASVFVTLHIPKRSTGILTTVARAAGPLQVLDVQEGMPIERGKVYLATADRHLIIADGVIRLGKGPRENMVRPSIDPMFRSAAVAFGPRVIGVVLSGLLNDGASGLDAIKSCGGKAVIQDPADALAEEMPLRASEATSIDFSLPAAMLGDALSRLSREAAGPALPVPAALRLEVDIAAGAGLGTPLLSRIATPAALTCPSCGGVLSVVHDARPVRFRCQVGHAFTADLLAKEQEDRVDEALRVALRIIEERADLVSRMAQDGRNSGRPAVAEMYEERAQEYREQSEIIRRAVLESFLRADNVRNPA